MIEVPGRVTAEVSEDLSQPDSKVVSFAEETISIHVNERFKAAKEQHDKKVKEQNEKQKEVKEVEQKQAGEDDLII